ncbi:MAG: hypothetical protein ACRDP7_30215 [Trebonia sp.]
MAIAVVLLIGGLWEGLVYLGLPLAAGQHNLHVDHGPLMVLGFLGTLISLERAVALGPKWAYLAPAGAAAGGLAVACNAPNGVGQAVVTFGGVMLVAIFVAVHRIQASVHNMVLASGAVCWVVAGVVWTANWDIPRFIPWLTGFLVLTITGERLELSRLTGRSRRAGALFVGAAGLFGFGLIVSLFDDATGVRIAGAGLCCLAVWLARYDIAQRTVRRKGLTRYMAIALLAGYAWLATGGALWLAFGRMSFIDPGRAAQGSAYDAMLHAVFLGFVISMIFAHAPIIVPSVLGRPLPYNWWFYVPLVMLHVTLLLRLVGGDAMHNKVSWQWGGGLNEVALLLFVGLAAAAVIRAARSRRTTARPLQPADSPPQPPNGSSQAAQ